MADSVVMPPNQLALPGSPGDAASHLQFQISLLRLMDQKMMDQKRVGPKTMDRKDGSKVGPTVQVPSVQVMELERLQHPRRAMIRLKTRS
jgi:hypothetical protein